MDVVIHGHNVRVTDTLEAYTQKKLDRLDRYLPNISDIRVDVSRQRTNRGEDVIKAQITLRHRRGAILRAEETIRGEDFQSIQIAINEAVDNMYRRIQRFKGKRDRKGRERFVATIEELNAAESIPDFAEYAEEDFPVAEDGANADTLDQLPTHILRRKQIAVSAMTEMEAVEQMELLGHSFFVFFNSNTGGVNVLYKRHSGGYGVLVPNLE